MPFSWFVPCMPYAISIYFVVVPNIDLDDTKSLNRFALEVIVALRVLKLLQFFLPTKILLNKNKWNADSYLNHFGIFSKQISERIYLLKIEDLLRELFIFGFDILWAVVFIWENEKNLSDS